jgi:hypothetical protein
MAVEGRVEAVDQALRAEVRVGCVGRAGAQAQMGRNAAQEDI